MAVYRWVEHTGELELELEAPSRTQVFEEAFHAIRGLMHTGHSGPAQVHTVELSAADGAALLADWLAELAYLGESRGFVPERLDRLEVDEAELAAALAGFTGSPAHLVKGVTYHRLSLEQTASRWHATVVLDV